MFLHRIYKSLNAAKREWSITKQSMSMAQMTTSFSVASEFQSVPDHIRQDFRESASEIEKQYQFRISDRDIKIIFTFSNDQFDKSDTFCQECIEKIFLWLYIAIYYGSPAKPCSEPGPFPWVCHSSSSLSTCLRASLRSFRWVRFFVNLPTIPPPRLPGRADQYS